MTPPSFRFYLHAAAHKEAGTDWQEKTLGMLTFDLTQGESPESKENLIAVGRILSNPIFTTEQQREAAFAELFTKGGSRPTYYRFKKRLQDHARHVRRCGGVATSRLYPFMLPARRH